MHNVTNCHKSYTVAIANLINNDLILSFCYWAGRYCLTIRKCLHRRLWWLTYLHTRSGRGLNGCSRNALSPPPCPATTSSYKTSQRTLYSTCAPLPSLSRASGISGMPINDGRRGEVSSGSVEANMQRHRSQRGRLSLLHRLLHSFAHSRFCLLSSCLFGGDKERYGGKKCHRTL